MTDAASGEAPESPSTEPVASLERPRGLRWWPGVVVLLLGAASFGYAHWRFADERTWRDAMSMITGMAVVFFLLVWWIFLSRAPVKIRTLSGIGTLVAVVGFMVLFEVDEITGSMIPRFRWRFAKSAEEKAVEFFADAETDGVAKPKASESDAPDAKPGDDADEPGDDGDEPRLDPGEPSPEPAFVIGPDDWPGFRGLNRDGISASPIRVNWDDDPPRELWRQPIGVGWSSFAVVDGIAFTQEQRGPEEMVVCYDVDTGKQIWAHGDETRFVDAQGGDGPRATPTVHNDRLYTMGASGLLNCLDALTGEVVWSRPTLEDAGDSKNLIWGQCGSPLVVNDVVVVNPGANLGTGEHGVVAYGLEDGQIRWTSGKNQASYCSPRVERIGGVQQVLIFDAAGLSGVDPKYGKELWHHPFVTFSDINVAQPIKIDETSLFLAAGYSHGSIRIELEHDDRGWTSSQVWSNTRGPRLKFQSAVRVGDYVYGLDDGILACHDLVSGEQVWKDRAGEYGFGQLLLAGDHILVTVEKTGEVALVRASPDGFDEVGRFQALGQDGNEGIVWNHLALWHGRLLVRNAREAACYDIGLE